MAGHIPPELAQELMTIEFDDDDGEMHATLLFTDEANPLIHARLPEDAETIYQGHFISATWSEGEGDDEVDHWATLYLNFQRMDADGVEYGPNVPEATLLTYVELDGDEEGGRELVLKALQGAMKELSDRRTKSLRRETAQKLTTIGHATQFPPEMNAKVMEYIVPKNVPTPDQRARKAAAYKAMVKSGPVVESVYERRRAADKAEEKKGGRTTKKRKTKQRKTLRRRRIA